MSSLNIICPICHNLCTKKDYIHFIDYECYCKHNYMDVYKPNFRFTQKSNALNNYFYINIYPISLFSSSNSLIISFILNNKSEVIKKIRTYLPPQEAYNLFNHYFNKYNKLLCLT